MLQAQEAIGPDELSQVLERIHLEMTDSPEEEGVLKIRIYLKNADEAETRRIMSGLMEIIRQKKLYLLPAEFPKQPTFFKVLKRILLPSEEIIVPDRLDHDGSLFFSVVLFHKKMSP